MWRSLTFFILLLGYGPAFATSYEQAQTSLQTGQFDLAHSQAVELSTNQGSVLAAEALNAKLLLGLTKNSKKTAKAAMAFTNKVLQQEPQNPEAQLQYAIAYGFYGRQVSPFKAWRKKTPLKILAEINKARALSPNDARTSALLGAWHLSVVQRAGMKSAKKLYGANEKEGIDNFEIAQQAAPDDLVILANYTLMHYLLDPQTRELQTKKNLEKIISATSGSAVEAQLQSQMQPILAAFNDDSDPASLAEEFITR